VRAGAIGLGVTGQKVVAWADYLFCRAAYEAKRVLVVVGPLVFIQGAIRRDLWGVLIGVAVSVFGIVAYRSRTSCPMRPSKEV